MFICVNERKRERGTGRKRERIGMFGNKFSLKTVFRVDHFSCAYI